jgi:stage V sporulation protein K
VAWESRGGYALSDIATSSSSSRINIVLKPATKIEPIEQSLNIPRHKALMNIQNELDKLVGLDHIKKLVKEIYALLFINLQRQENNLKTQKQTLHMIFKGNPGTGKTTVARLLGKLFVDMNVLSKGHFMEVDRSDLVGEYIGHTAQKTRELIKKSQGGILFIDEAYSLARGGEKDFGKEAIDTLVKWMEEYSEDLVVILAGYPKDMDYFLSKNAGLPSRFPIVMDFPDFTAEELIKIAQLMVTDRDYELTAEALRKLMIHLQDMVNNQTQGKTSNGRYIRNLIEKAIREQAVRLLHETRYHKDNLILLTDKDLDIK